MKEKLNFIFAALLVVSCKKEPEACIDGPLSLAEGETATYTWCGKNAKTIDWTMSGQTGSGNSFTPQFSFRGKSTIEVHGTNGQKQRRTSIEVEYGKASKTKCTITNQCYSGNQNLTNGPELAYYWAYLYNTRADWITDVSNGKHLLVIDSVNFEFSSDPYVNTAVAIFNKPIATGSGKIISVEYRNPNQPSSALSNWADIFYSTTGTIDITNTEFSDNLSQTRLTDNSKVFLKGKWVLSQSYINGSLVPLPQCNKDDYLKFYADGTWKFFVGADNCSGSSQPSNGTFGTIPQCGQLTFVITTVQGTFTSQYCTFNTSTIQVYFTSGANNGYFVFTYQ